MPEPHQCQIWAESVTYITTHNNAGSLTHGARPGIKPSTSWFLVGFVSTEPRRELLFGIIGMHFSTAFSCIYCLFSFTYELCVWVCACVCMRLPRGLQYTCLTFHGRLGIRILWLQVESGNLTPSRSLFSLHFMVSFWYLFTWKISSTSIIIFPFKC